MSAAKAAVGWVAEALTTWIFGKDKQLTPVRNDVDAETEKVLKNQSKDNEYDKHEVCMAGYETKTNDFFWK